LANGATPKPNGLARPDPTFVWAKLAWVKKARVHFLVSFFRPVPFLTALV